MHYEYLTTEDKARAAVESLVQQSCIGIDVETTGLDPRTSRVRLLQAAAINGQVAVFDLDQVPVDLLRPLSAVEWATFNGQFEYQHLSHLGMDIPRMHDAMLLDRLVSGRIHSLGDVAGIDKAEQKSDWSGELSDSQIHYAAADPLVTIRLVSQMLPLVPRTVYDLWRDVIPVLAASTMSGQNFDWAAHSVLLDGWKQEQERLLAAVHEYMPDVENIRSSKQLGEWLQNNLPEDVLAKWPRTGKGALKTDMNTWQLYADLPVIAPLVKYKQVNKLITAYGDGYSKFRHILTGNLHPQYHIGRTVTGRLACSNPNVQNPPRESWFRELFAAPEGMTLVSADFSQIELRVAALLSNDFNMIDSYAAGIDLHAKTAAAVAGVPLSRVTKKQRQAAKPVNFGTLYGQRAPSLASTAKTSYGVDMTVDEAQLALSQFSRAYPQLSQWQRKMRRQASESRQVVSRSGLVRDFDVQGGGYIAGEAVNMPVQASAAEVLMASLKRLSRSLYGTVHDEITLVVPNDEAGAAAAELEAAMQEGFLEVFPEGSALLPGLVEVSQGSNWAEIH